MDGVVRRWWVRVSVALGFSLCLRSADTRVLRSSTRVAAPPTQLADFPRVRLRRAARVGGSPGIHGRRFQHARNYGPGNCESAWISLISAVCAVSSLLKGVGHTVGE